MIIPRISNKTNETQWLPPPSKDPFYKPPDGWEATKPGTVLRTRKHAYYRIRIRNCIDVFQLQFRTTDTIGNPSWAIGTIFVPASNQNCTASNLSACGHGLVSYQIPTDSSSPNAAPSFLLQARDPYGEVRDLLANGWFVFVPDYEGPLASFCAGAQSGHATLDGAQAAVSVGDQYGLRKDKARVAFWGYSGGAFATAFAAELAQKYAPDFKIAGVIIGGPSPNLTTVNLRMNKRDTAGIVFESLIGITQQQDKARKFLMDRLKTTGPYNTTAFFKASKMTAVDALTDYAYQDIYDYFINGESDFWEPVLQNLFDDDGMIGSHGIPNMPVFVYKAIQDEMSPVIETDTVVKRYCDGGARVLYHRNTLGHHNDELWMGRARTMDFISTIIDDTNKLPFPAHGCQTVKVTVPMNLAGLLPDDMSDWQSAEDHIPGSSER
ncbi:LIP-domain-containing protein [Thozetella sp. PMI_491]|nr:LIP-domain-containing protein [Thozetella sp. PMI_491]